MVSNRLFRAAALLSAASMALSGCALPVAGASGNYAHPIGNATVTANPTPYSAALVCLANYGRQARIVAPRIAIGRIATTPARPRPTDPGASSPKAPR